MKFTTNKKNWVINRVARYCKLLQINPPKIFFTMAEYNCWKQSKRTVIGQRVGRSQCLGVCHKDEGFIAILVKRSPNLSRLDQTIRHELIHYSKPSYNHRSQEFYDRMKRLELGHIKNGRFN